MKLIFLILMGFVQLSVSACAQGWQDKSLSIENNLNKIQFIDQNHGWIVGDSGIILKYNDGNWISIGFQLNQSFQSITSQGYILMTQFMDGLLEIME